MKKLSIFLFLLISFLCISISTFAASYKFEWYNTYVEIPVGDSSEKYKNIPYARLYVDGAYATDARVTYNYTGDWLYFFEDINTKVVGEYKVWYKAYENYKYCPGTCTNYKALITFRVVDKIAPKITVLNNHLLLERGTSNYDFSKNIKVTDNYDSKPDISISHSIDFNTNGIYSVYVYATDSSNNQSYAEFDVEIYGDVTPPVIKVSNPIVEISLTTSNYDPNINFNVFDDSGYDCNIKLDYDIEYGKIGDYPIYITASDKTGNISNASFIVRIVDTSTPPMIKYNGIGNIISIPINKDFNIKELFTAYDSIDGDITDSIFFPSFDNSSLGEYDYVVSVINSYDKKTEYKLKIKVIDEDTPKITLTTHNITLDYKTDFDSFNFKKYVLKITDDSPVDMNNLRYEYNLENKVGNYYIRYYYSDGLHTTEEVIDVRLLSNNKPIIETNSIEIVAESTLDLKDYISVIDESDSAIYDSIEIDDTKVKYDTCGTYYIKVYALNSSGLSNEKRVMVKVTSKGLDTISIIFISVLAVLLLIVIIGAVLVVVVFKRLKCK